jgi:arsenate reductase
VISVKIVLFVCIRNAGRSQMAEAFFNQMAPPDLRAESAGSDPARRVHPAVVEAMREEGIDLSDRRPVRLDRETQLHADRAVLMGCGDMCPYVATSVEDWDVPDPADRPIEEVRLIRDDIKARVREMIEQRGDLIRADRTAHQIRLGQLLRMLDHEFDDIRSDAEIRACADAILHRFDDTQVKAFRMTLAYRQARECLRADTCEALAEVA